MLRLPLNNHDSGGDIEARKTVKVACARCRTRKVACDASRPKCGRCIRDKTECVFAKANRSAMNIDALARENDMLKTVVQKLQDRIQSLESTNEAVMVASASTLLYDEYEAPVSADRSVLHGHRSGIVDSGQQIGRQPSINMSPEYELWSRCATAYPPLFPFAQPQLVADTLLGQSSDTMDRLALDYIKTAWFRTSRPTSQQRKEQQSYLDRLCELQIQLWTDIPITNEYAAAALRMYLETEHPVIARFESTLFIRDLIEGRGEYCSYLLVHALLCHAIVRVAHIDPNATDLSLAFFRRAKLIWNEQRDTCHVLAIPALQMLIYAGAMHGLDTDSLTFTNDCSELVMRLGLRDTTGAEQAQYCDGDLPDELKSTAQIAWGYFVSASLWAFAYRWPLPTPPANLPIPGSIGFHLPTGMGNTFTCICRFWVIVGDAILRFGDLDSDPENRIPLYITEHSYRRLLQWVHDLPQDCIVDEKSSHHVMVMHIWFHTAVIALTRPWLKTSHVLRYFISHNCTIGAVYGASIRQLKRLLVNFMLHYPQSRYHVYWHVALIYMANAVLTSSADTEWRFYFLICLRGYMNFSSAYGFAPLCYKGLLTIAMEKEKISVEDAKHMLRQMVRKQEAGNIRSTNKLGIRLATADTCLAQNELSAEEAADMFDKVALAQTAR